MITVHFYNFGITKQARSMADAERICRKACFESAVFCGDVMVAKYSPITNSFTVTDPLTVIQQSMEDSLSQAESFCGVQ